MLLYKIFCHTAARKIPKKTSKMGNSGTGKMVMRLSIQDVHANLVYISLPCVSSYGQEEEQGEKGETDNKPIPCL
jgi:hypothetical protein